MWQPNSFLRRENEKSENLWQNKGDNSMLHHFNIDESGLLPQIDK